MEIWHGAVGPGVRLGRERLFLGARESRSVGKIPGTGKILRNVLFLLGRFLYGESPEVLDDELDMLDRSAGLG
jgi:hypothetical protein